MPGVTIRISKDSSDPDSVKAEVYKEPFAINESMVLKARACKDGWYCSDILEVTCFVEGIAPAHVELLSPADKQYPGKGAPGLTDLQKGFADIFKEPSWLGYRSEPFSAAFDFETRMSLKEIVISYGKNIGGFIFPPDEVEIWAGDDKKNLKLTKESKIKTTHRVYAEWRRSTAYRYLTRILPINIIGLLQNLLLNFLHGTTKKERRVGFLWMKYFFTEGLPGTL